MSPTARMLVEEVLKEARSNHSKAKLEKAKDSAGDQGGVEGREKSQAYKALVRHFTRMGWKPDHVRDAITNSWNDAEDSVDPDFANRLNARGNPVVSRVLDWLCLHVPESELPKGFEPLKALEVGISAFGFQSKRGGGESDDVVEGGAEEVGVSSPEVRELMDVGFSKEESERELGNCAGNTEEALRVLYESLLQRALVEERGVVEEQRVVGESQSVEELEELRKDEIAALASIMADDFVEGETTRGRVLTLKLSSIDPPLPLALATPPLLEITIPLAPINLYPFQYPIVQLKFAEEDRSKIPRGLLLEVLSKMAKEAASMLGSPLIYSLVLWVQSNLASLTRGFTTRPTQRTTTTTTPSSNTSAQPKTPMAAKGKEKKPNNNKANRKPPIKFHHRGPKALSEYEFASISEGMKKERQAIEGSEGYQPMKRVRQKLPAWEKRDAIAALIRASQVVVLTGSTGCGKSTQVPQFVLDDMIGES